MINNKELLHLEEAFVYRVPRWDIYSSTNFTYMSKCAEKQTQITGTQILKVKDKMM
jgi:hypothetical protein